MSGTIGDGHPILVTGTTFAVADLHGRFDLLDAALAAIEAYGAAPERGRTVIFLGDYVNRGPRSAQILDRLSAVRQRAGGGSALRAITRR